MTDHHMHLTEGAFERIKSGKKIMEVRLFDEKHRKIKIGDTIFFSNEIDQRDQLKVKVVNLSRFNSFEELVNAFPINYFGRPENFDKNTYIKLIYKIYTKEDEKKYGVLGIKIKLV